MTALTCIAFGAEDPVRRDVAAAERASIGQPEAQSGETEDFLRAKRLVFDQRWDDAREGMERYLRDHPSGTMRDEALYWLAQSSEALARKEADLTRVVALERLALESLDRVIRDFPRSLWCDDARDLRLRTAGLLAVLGQPPYEDVIPDAGSLSAAKSLALDGVAGLSRPLAFAAFDRVLRADPDPAIRRKAVALVALTFVDEARAALEEVARYDADREVRDAAHDVLARLGSGVQPITLAYSCFDARVTDRQTEAKLPAGRIAAFAVPGGHAATADEARRLVKGIFMRGLALGNDRAEGYDEVNPFASEVMSNILSRSIVTQHAIGSFVLGVVPRSLRRTAEGVAGEVRFDALVAPFEVDARRGVVLAARHDDRVALMYLRTVPRQASTTARHPAASADTTKRQRGEVATGLIYCRVDHLDRGIVIRSTRCSAPLDGAKVVDYGQAVAEIPAAGGTWTLTGEILVTRSDGLIVGRLATLVRPDGSRAATADEIRVPFGDPSSFTARGLRSK